MKQFNKRCREESRQKLESENLKYIVAQVKMKLITSCILCTPKILNR